jgi:hypothetical protein
MAKKAAAKAALGTVERLGQDAEEAGLCVLKEHVMSHKAGVQFLVFLRDGKALGTIKLKTKADGTYSVKMDLMVWVLRLIRDAGFPTDNGVDAKEAPAAAKPKAKPTRKTPTVNQVIEDAKKAKPKLKVV